MKYIKYIISAFAILFLWSCDTVDLEQIKASPDGEMVGPVLETMSTVAIDQASYDDKATTTFSWAPANFGFPAAINYAIYMSSDSVADYQLAANINAESYTIDYQALYDKLIGENGLQLPTNEVSTIPVYVTATVGSNFTVVKSAAVNISFDIKKIGLAGDKLQIVGQFNGNSWSKTAITGVDKVYSGYADMNWKDQAETKYKFFDFVYASAWWGDQYGGSLDALSTSGGDLVTTPGMKYFSVDLNTKTGSIVNFTKVGLTGLGGWQTPSMEMTYDYDNNYYYIVTAADGGASFRILCYAPDANPWGYTLGPRTIPDLSLTVGSDVKVFDNNISKPLVGGDANMKMDATGTYKFILYYTSTDAIWHFKVERP